MNPPAPRPSIGVHSVLFHTAPDALARSLEAINRAAEFGWLEGGTGAVHVRYGDCSPRPVVSEEMLAEWRSRFPSIAEISVEFFGENLGHGGAQNRLAHDAVTDLMVIANPDVVPSARALSVLADTLSDPTVGIVEAKQLPLEHPKDYDRRTGATSWCSGAFSMVRTSDFRAVGGFDHATFFMYCDDVDLSWRLRLHGLGAVIQPSAVVFHDKRLSVDGTWVPTDAERYYSAEAALLLAHKWSRSDLAESLAESLAAGGDPVGVSAVDEFRRRMEAGTLAPQIDGGHRTADFTNGTYGAHRFAL